MKLTVNQLSACRACGGHRLTKFLEFLDVPLVDNYLTAGELRTEFLYPLRVYICEHCHLVQTQHDVDASEYYRDYHYSVSFSPFAERFMHVLAEALYEQFDLQPGDTVLEVGSSDGLQLSCFAKLGAKVFGFEPAANLAEIARSRGVPTAQTLFLPETISQIPAELLPLRVVVLTYTFDHLGAPLTFLDSVRTLLDTQCGLLVIEVHDLAKIVERREYPLFQHEHPAYYSLNTIRDVLRRGGFELLSIDLVPEALRRGNSLLVVATLQGTTYTPSTATPGELEHLTDLGTYRQFGCQVKESIANFRQFVQAECARGRCLAGYGAGGRGIMTLAMSGVGNEEMVYLCDMNSSIHGYYTPKSHIPIVPPDYILRDWVDEVIVFSFGYIEEIACELAQYTDKGGQLISLLELL